MNTMTRCWILQGDDPAPTPPVPAGVEYHRVYVDEYGFRGFMFRVLGSWTREARSGAILGIVVTTVLFSLAHGTLDPFLLTSYLVPSAALILITATVWWMTRRSGPARTPADCPASGFEQ